MAALCWWASLKQPQEVAIASNRMTRMRYALTLLLLTALAVAQNTGDAPPSSPSSTSSGSTTSSGIPSDQENAAKAKQLVQQAIQALGGQAYLTWRTQTSQGRSYSFHHGEPNSLGTLVWRFRQYPDKDRLELTKKRDIFEIFNGDKGWEVTYSGVRNLEGNDIQPYMRRRHYSLDLVLREWINQPGVAFFY